MRGRGTRGGAHRTAAAGSHRRGLLRHRRALSLTATVGLLASVVIAATIGNAGAVQATGDDVASWATGWSWSYATTFNYNDGNGTVATITENVTYTNGGVTTFNGQSAYNVDITGTITGGSGTAVIPGTGTVNLSKFSGTVTGSEKVRRSDLALLQEIQNQNLNATATLSIISTGVTAVINLEMDPNPGWKTLAFPLNNGDAWTENTDVVYSGGFSYNSSLASGSSPFSGDFPFNGPAGNATQTVSVPIGNVATDAVSAASTDGSTVDDQWWSPGFKNLAREHLQLPLNGASLIIDRSLSAASTPAPGSTLSETITPSLSCAGGQAIVAGRLSSGASGTPLAITVDQSAASPGLAQNVTTTTTAGGNYSATITVPAVSDGLAKSGVRGGFGVIVDGGGASVVATQVATTVDCTSLSYTGATAGSIGVPATVSATLTDLATGAGAAGQSVTFALAGGSTVTAVADTSGVASTTVPLGTPARTAAITASFAGTPTLAAASAASTITVALDGTTTSVVASTPSVTINNPVSFTATVTPLVGSNPGGSVQFAIDGANFGAPVAVSGGHATSAPNSTLTLGDHFITATYLSDATFAGSVSPQITVHVHIPLTATTTVASVDDASSVSGQTVTLGATVTPNTGGGHPTGAVTFTDGGTQLGTASVVNGAASLPISTLPVGAHSIVATYAGDDTFDSSASAPISVTVAKDTTTTTVLSSDPTSVTGQAVSYTASVTADAPGSGLATGTAQLKVDGTNTGPAVTLSGGSAVFPAVTGLSAGPHTVSVAYSGDGNLAGSTGSVGQTVDKAATTTALTASPSPSAEDQDVTLTATVSATAPGTGSPTGTVTFTVDGADIGVGALTPTAHGSVATLDTSTLAPGGHAITATYGGDSNYLASDPSTTVSQTVIEGSAVVATTTALAASTNPSTFGLPISYTATVTAADNSTPVGSVQFAVDGTTIGDPVAVDGSGVAVSPTLASPEPGDHFVTAAYLPNAAYAASGASLTQTVATAGDSATVTSSSPTTAYGAAVHFHATVTSAQLGTGSPDGAVQFRVDGVALGAPVTLSGGAADSPSIASLTPGTHAVSILYTGSVDFLPAIATTTQTVTKIATTTKVVSSANPSTYGGTVTFTATVTPGTTALGSPTGTVTFTDGSTTLGTAAVAGNGTVGTATLTTTALGGGAHPIVATYSGSATFTGSASAPLSQTVNRATTSINAQAAVVKVVPLGLPLGTLQATLNSPNGSLAGQPLVFKIGTVTACTATTNAAGVATCSAQKYLVNLTLNFGYTVSFAGDANYQPSSATAGLIQ